ncbi:MAG TPA: cation:proton antiporter [Aggregatilineales bacterium]|nr:cation:proton antiporter [Anaerolineales bacterium]HRE46577.1 cation:proton antiporter [Aggregatilineales bacterium]
MPHDLALFATITMAVLTAFIGGYVARRLGLPALVGYLVAGLIIGPFTPGFVGDASAISQLAEMGVIFMMFGVGLHFSLKDLWSVRHIAIPGAVLQTLASTFLGVILTQLWGWSMNASLVLGLSISIASTVVLLRGLADSGLLNTSHGKVAIGWLVFEDLATVAILVLMPALLGSTDNVLASVGLVILKTGLFIVIMLFAGARFMPWILTRIAHTRSRELFILAVVALALGTAFAAAELFGVSLALGAFLAGVVVSESKTSHQVGAEIIPFRDVFTVLFFVSVGMLVNPTSVVANIGPILTLTILIVVGKGIVTLLLSFILPASGRTLIVVAAGLSQIGEFSFIVGQTGVSLGILTRDQYGFILAGALLSIVVNPLMFRAIPTIERILQQIPILWNRMEKGGPTPLLGHKGLTGHVVIVGYGRVGTHIGRVLEHLKLPYLVVEQDVEHAEKMQQAGIQILFGDAANSEVITHAGLDHASALIVTVPDEAAAELVVAAAHAMAPTLPIIARAGTESGIERLSKHGARHVIHPELEGGLEIVRHTLMILDYPMTQIQHYVDAVRQDAYKAIRPDHESHPVLDQLISAVRGVEIDWQIVSANSPILGKNLAETNLRANVGASVIALIRDKKVLPNPKSNMVFMQGDMVGFIGTAEELVSAAKIINPPVEDQ